MKHATPPFSWDRLMGLSAWELLGIGSEQVQGVLAAMALFHAPTDEAAVRAARQAQEAGAPLESLLLEAAHHRNARAFDALRTLNTGRPWWQPQPAARQEPAPLSPLELSLEGQGAAWVVDRAAEDGLDFTQPLVRQINRTPLKNGFGLPYDERIHPLTVALKEGAFDAAERIWALPGVSTHQDGLDEALLWMASIDMSPTVLAWADRLRDAGANPNRVHEVLPPWALDRKEGIPAVCDTSGRRWAHRVATLPPMDELDRFWTGLFPLLRPAQWPPLGDDALARALADVPQAAPNAHARQALDVLMLTKRPTTTEDTVGRAIGAILDGSVAAAVTQELRDQLEARLREIRPRSTEEVTQRALAAGAMANGYWLVEWAVAHEGRPLSLQAAVDVFRRHVKQTRAKPSFLNPDALSRPGTPHRAWSRFMNQDDAEQWMQLLNEAKAIQNGTPIQELSEKQQEALELLMSTGDVPTTRRATPRL